ncbi:MAG: hypothetical protein IT236_15600 [Bacteroidia bacterium]|nr:hypothetical protein [Bacteroidia bacterium]
MRISLLISLLSHIPIFITTGYALWLYKKLENELRVFSWFLFITGVIQFVALLLALKGINNMPLLHIYVLLSFIFLALFYKSVLQEFIDGRIILFLALLFGLYTCFNSVFIQSVFTFNSKALTIESILVIILSISTYVFFLNSVMKESKRDLTTSLNWINSGLFIYYTSNLLIYYFGNVITGQLSKTMNLYAWVLHSFFSVIMYTCFFIGLWKRPKT